jgi:hypothetical protein
MSDFNPFTAAGIQQYALDEAEKKAPLETTDVDPSALPEQNEFTSTKANGRVFLNSVDDIITGLASGDLRPRRDRTYQVVDPNDPMTPKSVSGMELPRALKKGWTFDTQEMRNQRVSDIKRQQELDVAGGQNLLAGAEGFARGLTFDATYQLASAENKRQQDLRAEANPLIHGATKTAGIVAPLLIPGVGEGLAAVRGGAEAATLARVGGSTLGRLAARSVGRAAEGALIELPHAASEVASGDHNVAAEKLIFAAGLNVLLGGAGDAVSSGVGRAMKLASRGEASSISELSDVAAAGMSGLKRSEMKDLPFSGRKQLGQFSRDENLIRRPNESAEDYVSRIRSRIEEVDSEGKGLWNTLDQSTGVSKADLSKMGFPEEIISGLNSTADGQYISARQLYSLGKQAENESALSVARSAIGKENSTAISTLEDRAMKLDALANKIETKVTKEDDVDLAQGIFNMISGRGKSKGLTGVLAAGYAGGPLAAGSAWLFQKAGGAEAIQAALAARGVSKELLSPSTLKNVAANVYATPAMMAIDAAMVGGMKVGQHSQSLRRLGSTLVAEMSTEHDERDRIGEAANHINSVADQIDRDGTQLGHDLSKDAPNVSAAFNKSAAGALRKLASEAPYGKIDALGNPMRPTRKQMDDWYEKVIVATQPKVALSHLTNGRARPEVADAMEKYWPSAWKSYREQQAMSLTPDEIGKQKPALRRGRSLVLGQKDNERKRRRMTADRIAGEAQAQQEQSRSKVKSPNQSEMRSMQTPADRLAYR